MTRETDHHYRRYILNEVKPLVVIKNQGRYSRVEVLGIDISRAVTKVEYSSHSSQLKGHDEELCGEISLKIEINNLLKILRNCDPYSKKEALTILNQYIKEGS